MFAASLFILKKFFFEIMFNLLIYGTFNVFVTFLAYSFLFYLSLIFKNFYECKGANNYDLIRNKGTFL